MKQYLCILLRNQFNLFYRFSYTVLPQKCLVEFDGNINEEVKEKIVNQFGNTTPFEYDEEYLILHFEKEEINNDFIQFQIQELVAIYPLSQQAKISIESKIDTRIKLEEPIFEIELPKIEAKIEKEEVKKAIIALWKICNIKEPLDKYISNLGNQYIFSGLNYRKEGVKSNKIQGGNYLEYLIAYDRFDYFPNSILGNFYDSGQIFAYSKACKTFDGSAIHSFLERLNTKSPTIKMSEIIKQLEESEDTKKYIKQATMGEVKQYIVTPLYLMIRDEIRKADDVGNTSLFKNLEYLKKHFADNFYYAVILLGAFFGFRKFYDQYYNMLDLRFYKKTVIEETHPVIAKENKSIESKPTEAPIENNSIGQNSKDVDKKKENTANNSDILNEKIKGIIKTELSKESSIEVTKIGGIIRKDTGEKLSNKKIIEVVAQISDVKVSKKGKKDIIEYLTNKEPKLNFDE